VLSLSPNMPLTCYSGSGFVWSWFRSWLQTNSRWRGLHIGRTQLCLCEPLHHCTVLGVAVPAAALLLPAVLGHYKVVAAVVAEDAATKPTTLEKDDTFDMFGFFFSIYTFHLSQTFILM